MTLKLRTITFFVADMDNATNFFSEILNLKAVDITEGWSEYKVSKVFTIAFHKGIGCASHIMNHASAARIWDTPR